MATIKEIADACELSTITVSRALRDGSGVSPLTRDKVLSYAKKIGYRPNLMAQNLRNGKTYLIAAIVSNYADEFVGGMLRGIQRQLFHNDFQAITLEWGADETEASAEKLVETIVGRNVEGILMARWGHPRETAFFDEIVRQKIPMVALDREPFLPGIPFVGTNDRKAAFAATEYLILKGHKDIGHISGPLDSSPGKERLLGFYEAMSKHGLRVNADWVIEGDWKFKQSEENVSREFIRLKHLPTAVFTASDLIAAHLIQAASTFGIKVPHDISVIGFADEKIARMMVPALTTMHQSPEEIGVRGAKLLIDMIEGKGQKLSNDIQNQRILVETQLIERHSVREVTD